MTEDFTIHEITLSFSSDKSMVVQFLKNHHLAYEDDIETAFGIFDSGENLVGCGCCAGNILKCFAVSEDLRGQNALGSLVSRLVENRFQAGYYDLFVVTRPKNKAMFSACGFYPLAETQSVLLLENKKNGPERFYGTMLDAMKNQTDKPLGAKTPSRQLSPSESDKIGCIVMNCNPFTKGHLALITYAASLCETLHIFVVEEDCSLFPFPVRMNLVKEGTSHLPNVHVHPSGPYMISSATFPTYFLKEGEDASAIQSELDITLFASRIAPLFSITKRFAGEEPLDPVTANYNAAMASILPRHGITFHKIARVTDDGGHGQVISASRVRSLLQTEGVTDEVLSLVPPCTADYLKNNY